MTTSERFWPTPDGVNRKSRTALHGTGPRTGRGENYLHSSPPGLEQAVELSEGILPKEYDDASQLTPSASRFLTSSPEGSHASPGPPPDDARARQMTAISGQNLLGLWPPPGPVGACLKMLLVSSTWRTASSAYTLTWKRKATKWGASLFQLRLVAPRTSANAAGSSPGIWPTPNVPNGGRTLRGDTSDTGQTADGKKRQVGLANMVQRVEERMWWTPSAALGYMDTPITEAQTVFRKPDSGNLQEQVAREMWATPRVEGFDAGKHRGKAGSLHSQVKLLPTPRAIYGEHPGMTDQKHLTGAAMLPTAATSDWKGSSQEGQRRGQLSEVVVGMKLSAAWVSRLMGYPDGWLDDLPSDPIGKSVSPASRSTSTTG